MITGKGSIKRYISLLLAVVMVLAICPVTTFTADANTATAEATKVADPGTASAWEHMMGTDTDGNRYAGRVWADKSVYKEGDTAVLNTSGESGSSFVVDLEDDEAFQVIFSVLGSSMTTTTTKTSNGPLDVVLVLDSSVSMTTTNNNITRLQRVVEAANKLLGDLVKLNDVRIGIVSYNRDADTILPLDRYTNGLKLDVNSYQENYGGSKGGVITAYDTSGTVLGRDNGYNNGTNLQSGIEMGMKLLANAQNIAGRNPVAIVLTDGSANYAVTEGWYAPDPSDAASPNYGTTAGVVLSTILNAAYNRALVEDHYGVAPTVYGVSVDVSAGSEAHAMMNPGDATYGFSGTQSKSEIKTAYSKYTAWKNTQSVTHEDSWGNGWNSGSLTWTFDSNLPSSNAVTKADVIANVNYVDMYFDVSSSTLEETFDQIYEELTSGAFNPISDTQTEVGGTGVEHTPLIYVDHIGKYMEVKQIQSVTLFGTSYNVAYNSTTGAYTVEAATGTNPTTNEQWNTSDDIKITITPNADGTKKLEVRIDQEILPIILEQVVDNTVGGVSTATITELKQNPLRIYYTVGIDDAFLLPNGKIDISKIDSADIQNGAVTIYSNVFGKENVADASGEVSLGDAHVGFQPSAKNRYYYYQENHSVFTAVSRKDGTLINWDASEYGVRYEPDTFDLTYLTYSDITSLQDEDTVYNYVTYYHPTPSTTDAANAAEKVTYLVYSQWKYIKESIGFYDLKNNQYINYDATKGYAVGEVGAVVDESKWASTLSAYKQDFADAEIIAILGVGMSHRSSRLHNMEVSKTSNDTQTAQLAYAPHYTYETAADHNGNDVVIWLGNNGKLTANLETGIALTKAVTEPIGNVNDTYALTVTVPAGVTAIPAVWDAQGNAVNFTYTNNVLTVNVKAGETVYVDGIPAGTECTIGEDIPNTADYTAYFSTTTVKVPTVSEVLADTTGGTSQYAAVTVTNTPNKYGNLYITKEITSTHAIPDSIMGTEFHISVDVGTALKGNNYQYVKTGVTGNQNKTVDDNGKMTFTIKARETIEIFGLPEGTEATVTEELTTEQSAIFDVAYSTINKSGATADNDGKVTIPANANATAVITNTYTPRSVTVDLDIAGQKNLIVEQGQSLVGGEFRFKVQKWIEGHWENTTWVEGKWEDINGKTGSVTYNSGDSGAKTFTIENVLEGIVFDEVGSWAYQVLEEKGSVQNVTYDRTLYTFTVTVTDNDGQLVATVTDVNNNSITDGSYEVAFENTYHTVPVSIDIVKEIVNNTGDDSVSKAGFSFEAVRTDANWTVLDEDSDGQPDWVRTVSSDAAGEARFTATYKQAGTYYYVIKEVGTAKPGWSHSGAEYRVTVTVDAEQASGNLTANLTIVKHNSNNSKEIGEVDAQDTTKGKVTFVNTYNPVDATVDLTNMVTKEITGKSLAEVAGQFNFELLKVNSDGTKTHVAFGTNAADGKVSFAQNLTDNTLTFEEVGVYKYQITEIAPAGAQVDSVTGRPVLNGMSYDPTTYDLVVEVSLDQTNGKLVANAYFEDAVTNVATFRNVYTVTPTEYTISGTKTLTGRAMKVGEFTFDLYKVDAATGAEVKVGTATNKADGTFSFDAITYDQAGTYTYIIKEVEPATKAPGVTYTGVSNPITVKITVTDDNSQLVASADKTAAEIQFTNVYTAQPAQVTFNGTKTLEGGTLADNMFRFKLYQTDISFDVTGSNSALLDTQSNTGNSFRFDRSFDKTDTYFFAIVEEIGTEDGVVYDRTQHNFVVRIEDDGDGKLRARVHSVEEARELGYDTAVNVDVSFTNADEDIVTKKTVFLTSDPTTQIDGKQVKAGDVLTYIISYTNYNGVDVVADISDTIPQHTSYVADSATHSGKYIGGHLNWIIPVPKGDTVQVSFQVEVDAANVIVANQAHVLDGYNTYTTNEVKNHTVEDVVVKDVFAAADLTTSIDGKKVSAGDKLTYVISYTNATAAPADVVITDQLPANTTYVADSADNGGTHTNGTVKWNLQDVPAWATVEVSFSVTVNANVGAVSLDNKAVADDGTNQYTSNTVTNYTTADQVKKDVFNASAPTVSIDGKKVEPGQNLVYTISYKNTAPEKVSVTITDTIPANAIYLNDSADQGGVYTDGIITWTMEVEAGKTITVSFKVKVADVDDQTIVNTAKIQEGGNIYTTNAAAVTVEKPEPEPTDPPTDPTVPTDPETKPTDPETKPTDPETKPTDPEAVNPDTGDRSEPGFLFLLMILGAAAAVMVFLAGRKKMLL